MSAKETSMTPKDGLIKVRSLISSKESHLKRALAHDKDGIPVNPEDPQACKFCLVGAICAANLPVLVRLDVYTLIGKQLQKRGHLSHQVAYFNDRFQHQDVLQLLDEAIANV